MRKKILLVDDDEIFIEFIKNALEKKDYEVSTASNGRMDSTNLTKLLTIL
jgi:CheY-like chemotaxis protein